VVYSLNVMPILNSIGHRVHSERYIKHEEAGIFRLSRLRSKEGFRKIEHLKFHLIKLKCNAFLCPSPELFERVPILKLLQLKLLQDAFFEITL